MSMLSRTLRARTERTRRTGEEFITNRLAALAIIPRGSQLIAGIGDDCAIYRPRGSGEDLLFTSDLYIENTHFLRATHSACDVAHNALTRSLSDIAAMGGSPRFVLAAVSAAEWTHAPWLKRFFDTLLRETVAAGAVLAGGDLSHSHLFACDITLCGAVPKGEALLRSGARAGDGIYVSGALGGSALGLATHKGSAWKRHLNPRARLSLGEYIRKEGATSAMDLSDGLSTDLTRLCVASGVSAAIEPPPLFPGATLEQGLHGGEEYELLFTAPARIAMPSTFKRTPITRIGTISKGRAGEVKLNGSRLQPGGYDHFSNR